MRSETPQVALEVQSDGRLVALAGAGSEAAFTVLVGRYRRQLLSYCRRFESGSTSAEDILQQTLFNAWRALSAGRPVNDVRPWLYRIAHNVAISGLRRVHLVPAPGPVPGEAAADSAEDELERRTAIRQALAGMAALPSPQREVMLDSTIGGLSHEELAQFHGLSVGAVRGLIYRARTALRAAAAALTPGPLLNWLARRAPDGSSLLGGLAGGGSVALGGAWLKGGALIVAAGTLAGVAVRGVESHSAVRPAAPHVSLRAHGPSPSDGPLAGASFASQVVMAGPATASATAGPGAIAGGGAQTIGAGGRLLSAALAGALPLRTDTGTAQSPGQGGGGGSSPNTAVGWKPGLGGTALGLTQGSGRSSGSGTGHGVAATVPRGSASQLGSGPSVTGDSGSGLSIPVAGGGRGSSAAASPTGGQGASSRASSGQAAGGSAPRGPQALAAAARSEPRGGPGQTGAGTGDGSRASGAGSDGAATGLSTQQ